MWAGGDRRLAELGVDAAQGVEAVSGSFARDEKQCSEHADRRRDVSDRCLVWTWEVRKGDAKLYVVDLWYLKGVLRRQPLLRWLGRVGCEESRALLLGERGRENRLVKFVVSLQLQG
jgi:hypothetical protein